MNIYQQMEEDMRNEEDGRGGKSYDDRMDGRAFMPEDLELDVQLKPGRCTWCGAYLKKNVGPTPYKGGVYHSDCLEQKLTIEGR